jgi:chemotaxis protein CheZ
MSGQRVLSDAAAVVPELVQRYRDGTTPHAPTIAEDVVGKMDLHLSFSGTVLLREIIALRRVIEDAKTEIAEVGLDAIRGKDIPSATCELDAIVEHTATATNSILESCELLDKLAGTLDQTQESALQSATTRIYEACSFQDITGQRITKVVGALKAIEAKVAELSGAFGSPGMGHAPFVATPDPAPLADTLLNGPGLPHEAMCQGDIDALLADFD